MHGVFRCDKLMKTGTIRSNQLNRGTFNFLKQSFVWASLFPKLLTIWKRFKIIRPSPLPALVHGQGAMQSDKKFGYNCWLLCSWKLTFRTFSFLYSNKFHAVFSLLLLIKLWFDNVLYILLVSFVQLICFVGSFDLKSEMQPCNQTVHFPSCTIKFVFWFRMTIKCRRFGGINRYLTIGQVAAFCKGKHVCSHRNFGDFSDILVVVASSSV